MHCSTFHVLDMCKCSLNILLKVEHLDPIVFHSTWTWPITIYDLALQEHIKSHVITRTENFSRPKQFRGIWNPANSV